MNSPGLISAQVAQLYRETGRAHAHDGGFAEGPSGFCLTKTGFAALLL
jgi:hypothetical protein